MINPNIYICDSKYQDKNSCFKSEATSQKQISLEHVNFQLSVTMW